MLFTAFIISSSLSVILCAVLAVILLKQMRMRRLARLEHRQYLMMAIFSHQMRTPLTTIRWYTEMLLHEEVGKLRVGQLEYVNKVNHAVTNVIDSLNSFLTLLRLKRGNIVSNPTMVNLWDALEQTVHGLEDQWKDKDQTVVCQPGKKPLGLHIDLFILQSILTAILSNAIQYTPRKGTIRIDVGENAKEAIIHIQDSGIGMTDAEQKQVFSMFFRGEKAKQMNSNGDGIGLYVMKQILEDAGGSVKFTSSAGEGTTFIVTIPKQHNQKMSIRR